MYLYVFVYVSVSVYVYGDVYVHVRMCTCMCSPILQNDATTVRKPPAGQDRLFRRVPQ